MAHSTENAELNEQLPGDDAPELTERQAAALAALLASATVTDAARTAKLSPRTLWRYLTDKNFVRHYNRARRAAIEHASARLQGEASSAVKVLHDVAHNKRASATARVAAARAILEFALRVSETRLTKPVSEMTDEELEALAYG